MQGRQCFKTLGTDGSEPQPDNSMVFLVSNAADETCGICTVNETDRAVVTEQQIVGNLTDGRASWVVVTPDSQQELVMGRREPSGARLLFAPPLEVAQPSPQRQQPSVNLVG